ncbi:MAG: hypothetical protein AAFZ65_19615, partial [Planctomycetota bacterium]
LDRVHVRTHGERVEVRFDAGFEPDPDRWAFGLLEVGDAHQLAWGLRGAVSAPVVALRAAADLK